jgi:hypothetical protein
MQLIQKRAFLKKQEERVGEDPDIVCARDHENRVGRCTMRLPEFRG